MNIDFVSLECVSRKPAPISACEVNIHSPNREPPRQAVKEIGRRRGIPSPRIGLVLREAKKALCFRGWGEPTTTSPLTAATHDSA
jgi:hypothetical protein